MNPPGKIAVVGGGIAGLALGITLLPHAMHELSELGLEAVLRSAGVETDTSAFFNRFGQLIYQEPRGLAAGYPEPEVAIHRGKLHMALLAAARERLGADRVHTDYQCVGVSQTDDGARVAFRSMATGEMREPVDADLVVACDGVNSAIRRQYYPDEKLAFTGINTWRGVTWRRPILNGRTYMRIGSIRTGKIVIYPIENSADRPGMQLVNWVVELSGPDSAMNAWNKPGRLEDFLPTLSGWVFDWLDVPELIRGAEQIFEYPMVDKDPIERWTFGRVTLAGDAAHPMYPRGSNGSAQALIDVRVLADLLAADGDGVAALREYERIRSPATAQVVRTNRTTPPDYINIKVEELTGDRPFERLEDFISQEELKKVADDYRNIAGFALADRAAAGKARVNLEAADGGRP